MTLIYKFVAENFVNYYIFTKPHYCKKLKTKTINNFNNEKTTYVNNSINNIDSNKNLNINNNDNINNNNKDLDIVKNSWITSIVIDNAKYKNQA